MAKIANLQEVAVRDLKPYERNAKIHGKDQIEKLKQSIQAFGFLTPCLIDRENNLIAGHGRVMAAKELGIEKVPCVMIEDLTEDERRAYILADNRLSELGEWDMSLVSSELKELEDKIDITLTGFDLDFEFLDKEPVNDLETWDEIDKTIEHEQISQRGDIWQLGEHRLMVGDSTKKEDVEKLMDGSQADLLETDPPYNVAVSNAKGDTIENDNMSDFAFDHFLFAAFSNAANFLKDGGVFYIWHADSNGRQFRNACEEAGLKVRQTLIWAKNHFTLGRQDYQWMHEPCLYGWKGGAGHYFQDARNLPTLISSVDLREATKEDLIRIIEQAKEGSTIMREDRPMVDDLHPTMKPVGLIIKQIKNSTVPGQIVLDLFGGSGTTLIACEQLGRKCRMMEFDPKYADVIIKRYEEETGATAKIISREEMNV